MGRLLLFYVVPLVLTIFCLVDAITSREDDVRHLPKLWWLILILLFPVVGAVAWLVAGRPTSSSRPRSAWERPAPEFPEYDRPGRSAATDPEADAEFLKRVRERAEEQRRRHEQQRREREAAERPPEGDETATEG